MVEVAQIQSNLAGGNQTIRIVGAFDAVLQPEFTRIERELSEIPTLKVIADLHAADFMDSAGAGFIVRLFRLCERMNGTLKIIGANGQPLRLIRSLGIDRRIETIVAPERSD